MAHGNAMKNTGTVPPTAGRLVRRDGAGRAQVQDPANPLDIANKHYVDQFAQGQGRYIVAAQGPGSFSAPASSGYSGQMLRSNAAGTVMVFMAKEGGTYDPPSLYVSTDGGIVWTKTAATVPWNMSDYGYLFDRVDIWVEDANTFTIFAYAQSNLQVSKTTNGGASFTNRSVVPNAGTYHTMLAFGPDSAIVVIQSASSGAPLLSQKTTNAGQNWSSAATIAAGASNIYWGNVGITTPDAGQTFFVRAQRQNATTNPATYSVKTFKSTNGSTSWSATTDLTATAEPVNSYTYCRQKIHAVSSTTVLAVVVNGATKIVTVYRSTDAMATWNVVGTPYNLVEISYGYNIVFEKDAGSGAITLALFSTTYNYNSYNTTLLIVRTLDDGVNWTVHSRGELPSGYAPYHVSRRIVVDSQGRFLYTFGILQSGSQYLAQVREALKLVVST